jgi:hypothetical protein
MSEQLDLSMMDDIVIPDTVLDETKTDEPTEEPTTVEDTVDTPKEDPKPEEKKPEEEKIDLSLKGIEGDPIDDEGSDDGKSEVYKVLAEALKEEGFFTEKESVDNITNLQALADAFKDEIKKHEYEDLTDSQKRVLAAFRTGVPPQDVIRHEENLNQYNSITSEVLEENEELQKAIFMTDLMQKGISEGRAEKLYEISYDKGDLFKEASASLETLKMKEAEIYNQRIQTAKAQQAARQKAIEERQKAIKKSIYEIEKFLGEVSVTENLKSKVHSAMTDVVGYTENGQPLNALMKARMENPVDFETKLYYLFELTNGFKDIKRFSKQAESKAAKKLESLINNNTFIKDNRSPAYKQDPESYDADGIVSLI